MKKTLAILAFFLTTFSINLYTMNNRQLAHLGIQLFLSGLKQSDEDFSQKEKDFFLAEAAFRGNTDDVDYWLDHGANPNSKNVFGFSPVHWATMNLYPDVVMLLLKRGACGWSAGINGITPRTLLLNQAQEHPQHENSKWTNAAETIMAILHALDDAAPHPLAQPKLYRQVQFEYKWITMGHPECVHPRLQRSKNYFEQLFDQQSIEDNPSHLSPLRPTRQRAVSPSSLSQLHE